MMQPTTLCFRTCRPLNSAASLPRMFSTASLSASRSNTKAITNSTTATKKLPSTFFSTCRSASVSRKPTVSFVARRYASTTVGSAYESSATPASLTWNNFLALRKTRRRMSLASSIVCAVIVTAAGLSVVTASDLDSTLAQTLGLDPIAVLGLSTAGLACVGWLVGPMFGNAAFGVAYRGYRTQIAEKERAFYDRIKKHRVDPSNSSIANPVPDYYGEKIGSVPDYRRWLKDQRAFNLKRGRGS